MQKDIMILLPDTIYLKKQMLDDGIKSIKEECNIYYENIIHPFNEKWDVVIDCPYGCNLGNCWRLSDYVGVDNEFNLTLTIYNEYGEVLCSKTTKIILVEKVYDKTTNVMFVGDSMTFSQEYIERVFLSLSRIETIGTRSLNGIIKQEGRGGWAYSGYFTRWYNENGVSPFLFPKGIPAEKYYGSKDFADLTADKSMFKYSYYGFDCDNISDGMYYVAQKSLYQRKDRQDILISETPEFEFDFGKYLKRYRLDKPQIISILMGANDLQICPYEKSQEQINEYINNTKRMIDEIHKYDKNIAIIINLPVLGAEQYSWGIQLKCVGSEKMYRYNIMNGCKALLENFDNRQNENIYISPMIACIDVKNGFDYTYVKASMHTEGMNKVQSNWVHPNKSGYNQMGDTLAGVIEYIRKEE